MAAGGSISIGPRGKTKRLKVCEYTRLDCSNIHLWHDK